MQETNSPYYIDLHLRCDPSIQPDQKNLKFPMAVNGREFFY